MAGDDEIKIRISAEAAEALRNIGQVVDAEQRMASETTKAGQVVDAAASRARIRSARLQQLEQRLEQLANAEARHQMRITEGVQATQRDQMASFARRVEMERLGAVLGRHNQRQEQATALIRQSTQAVNESATAHRTAGGAMDGAITTVGQMASGYLSLQAAIMAANKSYDVWIRNTQEAAEVARNASNDIVAFAALQAGGTKADRVQRTADLAGEFGITDRGEAFNTVQAMQSAIGAKNPKLTDDEAFEQGLNAAREIFAATQLGVPIDVGTELTAQSIAQGRDPGDFARQAYIAGQASSRDPALIGKAAPTMLFYDDKEFGFAAAAELSGTFGNELPTYHRAAGKGLSGVSGAADYYKQHGVGEAATQRQRLEFLAKQGINTPEEFAAIGIEDTLQQAAIGLMVDNLAGINRNQKKIVADNKPGLFGVDSRKIDEELPVTPVVRQNEQLDVYMDNAIAFGDAGVQANRDIRKRKLRALAFRRAGLEQAGPVDLIEENESSAWDELGQIVFGDASVEGGKRQQYFNAEFARLRKELEAAEAKGPVSGEAFAEIVKGGVSYEQFMASLKPGEQPNFRDAEQTFRQMHEAAASGQVTINNDNRTEVNIATQYVTPDGTTPVTADTGRRDLQ